MQEDKARRVPPLGRWITSMLLIASFSALALFSSLGRHSEARTSALRRRLGPEIPELKFADMPRVVIIFLTVDGTNLKAIWDDWYAQWLDFMIANGAKNEIKSDDSNPYLNGVIFANSKTAPEVIERRAPYFTLDSVVPHPVPAARFRLLHATKQSFEFALKSYPDATHFSFVSDTTMPVKPFSHIWSQLRVDGRSKLDAYCMEHREGYPKHSQWITLTKAHAEALVAKHNIWNVGSDSIIRGTCPTLSSANDEYWPIRIVTENRNITSTDQWMEEFDARSMLHPLGTMNWRTYVDWGLFANENAETALGDIQDSDGSHPGHFKTITSRFLRTLVATDNIWFVRKISGDLMPVTDCTSHPLEQMSDSLGGELRRTSRPIQSPVELPFDFGPSTTCALKDILPIFLRHGAWFPVVNRVIPDHLQAYVTAQEDKLHIGEGGLYNVKYPDGTKVLGGLDQMLAGSLKGSNWKNGNLTESKIVVELRPLEVGLVDSLEVALKKAAGQK